MRQVRRSGGRINTWSKQNPGEIAKNSGPLSMVGIRYYFDLSTGDDRNPRTN
jgi:hypothetical protein